MDVVGRFEALVTGPDDELSLDLAMLLVAAQADPGLDVTHELAVLDELADGCRTPTLDHLLRHLFVDLGFAGNRRDYYDAQNSYLHRVVARRLGIPISLAVLTIVVGRRIGVPVAGVAMPGHFLLRDRVDPDLFIDPFGGGTLLDVRGCQRVFRAVHGPEAHLDPRWLEPVGSRAILRRVLTNLEGIHRTNHNPVARAGVLRLRALLPGGGPDEPRELASALAAAGDFVAAAQELEDLADREGGDRAEADLAAARRFRARLN